MMRDPVAPMAITGGTVGTAQSDMVAPRGLRSLTDILVHAEPGDAVLVSRRLTLRAWLTRPISCLISWRIREATGSRWNHVAGYIGDGELVEAEWNLGVKRTKAADRYPVDQYDLAIARPPSEVDREIVFNFWLDIASDRCARYDWRAILLMRIAAILWGPKGIREHVTARVKDGAWICSELTAAGWEVGGMAAASRALKVPGDFAEHAS